MTSASEVPPAADLEVDAITVAYPSGTVAVWDVSFHLAPGSICALVGINGSGKSTLFKAIMGFLRPVQGRIRIGGLSVTEA
ncbi:MAG: ATP-binding cassette domain-containing protein, partial [Verrucomicrobia bacterium]|nr:ATP-binding cassette domain-containing protein [Verrucomicrobiota bacterium]